MMTAVYIGMAVIGAALLLIAGMAPVRSRYSLFAREQRRSKATAAVLDTQREQFLGDLLSLQRVVLSLLLVVVTILGVVAFGWLGGIAYSCVLALVYGRVARLSVITRASQRLYQTIEPGLLAFVSRQQAWLRFIRSVSVDYAPVTPVSSRAELEHIINQADTAVISPDERAQLRHGLEFAGRRVGDVMLVRDEVPFVQSKELLGPLVLDDLHKTGHRRFVVVDGDLDHAVGLLDIQTMLRLDVKRSVTAGKAMDPRVLYIHQEQSLEQALAVCLDAHQSLLVVVDSSGATTGVIRLDDLTEALLGRQLTLQGESHETPKSAARAGGAVTDRAKKSAAH